MGRQGQVGELRGHLGEERMRETPKRQTRKIGQGGTEKKTADGPAQIAVVAVEYFESRLFPSVLPLLRVPSGGEPYCVRKVWAQG